MNKAPSQSLEAPAIPESFDAVVLPHLDAANRLARWLMRNDHDADDVVQEAWLRARRYLHRRKRPSLVPQDCSQYVPRLARLRRPRTHGPV
jgi:DNA-directed RNA polymerase specialized sigma24 family protein